MTSQTLDSKYVIETLRTIKTNLVVSTPNGAKCHDRDNLKSRTNNLLFLIPVYSSDSIQFSELKSQNPVHYGIALRAVNEARDLYGVAV